MFPMAQTIGTGRARLALEGGSWKSWHWGTPGCLLSQAGGLGLQGHRQPFARPRGAPGPKSLEVPQTCQHARLLAQEPSILALETFGHM